jgi:hypothetical protein
MGMDQVNTPKERKTRIINPASFGRDELPP